MATEAKKRGWAAANAQNRRARHDSPCGPEKPDDATIKRIDAALKSGVRVADLEKRFRGLASNEFIRARRRELGIGGRVDE